MRKKHYKLIFCLSALFISGGSFCCNNSDMPVPSEIPDTSLSTEASDTPLELILWAVETGPSKIEQRYIDRYNNTHPNARIRTVTRPNDVDADTIASFMSGTNPDMLILSDVEVSTYAHMGLLQPMDEYLEQWEDFENINPDILKRYEINGHYYGLPCGEYAMGLFYNKKLFAEAGITPPASWTWEEFLAAASALTNPEAEQYGFALNWNQWGNWWFQMFTWAAGGNLSIAGDNGELITTFTDDGVLKAAQFYRELQNAGCIQPQSNRKLDALKKDFAAGKSAMIYNGMDDIQSLLGPNLSINEIGLLPLPSGPGGTNATQLGGSAYVMTINLTKEKQQAVFDYYALVSSRDFVLDTLEYYHQNNIPYFSGRIRTDMDTEYDQEIREEFSEMLDIYTQNGQYSFYGSSVLTAFVDEAIQKIMTDDTADIRETFSLYEKNANKQAVPLFNSYTEH